MKYFVLMLSLSLLVASCSKSALESAPEEPVPTQLAGKWTQVQLLGNDYYGGPAYWKNSYEDVRVKFTSDGKYFRKYRSDTAYTYIGTYKNLSDHQIEVTHTNLLNPSDSVYSLKYDFEAGGYLKLGNYGFEGLIGEKFKVVH